MAILKKLAVVSFCAGTAFAITIAVIFFGISVYRQRAAEEWKTNQITGTFSGFGTATDEKGKTTTTLVFTYALENHTNADYRIQSKDSVRLFAKEKSGELQSNRLGRAI